MLHDMALGDIEDQKIEDSIEKSRRRENKIPKIQHVSISANLVCFVFLTKAEAKAYYDSLCLSKKEGSR